MSRTWRPTRNSGRLRVCHLGKYYPPARGGIETHVHALAHAQSKLGLDVRVVCVNHVGSSTTEEHDGDVSVTRCGRIAEIAKLDICPRLHHVLKHIDADILHLQVPNPTMLLGLAAMRAKIPLVITYQSDHIRLKIRGALLRPIERVVFGTARAIITTSDNYTAGSQFLRQYRNKIHVVPLGIDITRYVRPEESALDESRAIRRKYGRPLWMSCGRLIHYKGLTTAMRALADVPGTLLVIGDGPERSRLEADAVRGGVRARVVFLGAVQNVVPYFLAADALWFPSNAKSEAFGLVQVEAMAAGCPVINTNIPGSGVPWVCPNEEAGLTVPVGDSAAFAYAARRIATDEKLRRRLGEGGRARARHFFDQSLTASRCVDVYRHSLAASNLPHR